MLTDIDSDMTVHNNSAWSTVPKEVLHHNSHLQYIPLKIDASCYRKFSAVNDEQTEAGDKCLN